MGYGSQSQASCSLQQSDNCIVAGYEKQRWPAPWSPYCPNSNSSFVSDCACTPPQLASSHLAPLHSVDFHFGCITNLCLHRSPQVLVVFGHSRHLVAVLYRWQTLVVGYAKLCEKLFLKTTTSGVVVARLSSSFRGWPNKPAAADKAFYRHEPISNTET